MDVESTQPAYANLVGIINVIPLSVEDLPSNLSGSSTKTRLI